VRYTVRVLTGSPSLLTRFQPAQRQLLTRLADVALSAESTPCIRVRAKHAHCLTAVEFDTPLLALPVEGHKRVKDQQHSICVVPGEMFLVTQPTSVDVENFPDESTGRYVALGIPLEPHVLEAARQLVKSPVAGNNKRIASVPMEPYIADFNAWLNALARQELSLACHAVVGIVLRLYAAGYSNLLYAPVSSLSARIRDMISREPDREWTSAQLESSFGLSGATLRRHLAQEGVSLRELIANARLSSALTLLLTTDLPVKTVAARVGYTSISTFAKRFRERYGTEPSRIGGIGRV
jgi:AraC-like DNA-binding protein